MTAPIVGRLAPSPTGRLHLGHARTFLLAWWHARSRGGRVVLRIEDLDGPRVKPEFVDQAQRDLEWLGLDWDGAPRLQSRGVERLRAAASALLESRQAYPCVCSRADVRQAASAPQAGDHEVRYPGTCRGRFASLASARAETARDAGLRFRVPDGSIELHDSFMGPHRADVAASVGDFLVSKRDGTPAYQLAVVVDDAADGVTEVLRGDDLLPSTARQWHLQRALGLMHPTWWHVPLVVDDDGTRLAKRAESLALAELRARGVDPRAVVAWVAGASGHAGPARVHAAEVTAEFDVRRVPHTQVPAGRDVIARLLEARA